MLHRGSWRIALLAAFALRVLAQPPTWKVLEIACSREEEVPYESK